MKEKNPLVAIITFMLFAYVSFEMGVIVGLVQNRLLSSFLASLSVGIAIVGFNICYNRFWEGAFKK